MLKNELEENILETKTLSFFKKRKESFLNTKEKIALIAVILVLTSMPFMLVYGTKYYAQKHKEDIYNKYHLWPCFTTYEHSASCYIGE